MGEAASASAAPARFAEVAVDAPVTSIKTFSYSLPPGLELSPGHAVWVPFGARTLHGIVFELTESPAVEETRDIVGPIDPVPLLTPVQLGLARWISGYYFAPLFQAALPMLPPGFHRRLRGFVTLGPQARPASESELSPLQVQLLRQVERHGRVVQDRLLASLGKRAGEAGLRQLLKRGVLVRSWEMDRPKVVPKVVQLLRLRVSPKEAEREAQRLREVGKARPAAVLSAMAQAGDMPLPEVRKLVTDVVLRRVLVEGGLVEIAEFQDQRDPLAGQTFQASVPPALTPQQESAWKEIAEGLAPLPAQEASGPPAYLLQGVTGSGKTELYLRAVAEVIRHGKRAIVLVPEISLTPQSIARFAGRFPGRVAVLHSGLSLGERFDEWWRIQRGDFDVVIGSRSAVLAPQPDLGLIVLDEEHEWTYKQQDQVLPYHAREVALKLAELTGAKVILGSATPDVCSYALVQRGVYHILHLPQRVVESERGPHPPSPLGDSRGLPPVGVVDMRQELKAGNRSIFSQSLQAAAARALVAGEQVILFLNRRGSSTFVQCRDCGVSLKCRRCDLTLTHHAEEGKLVCHQCNYRRNVPLACPTCGSRRIRYLGVGTQKVAEEAAKTFPGARILRWDRDVVAGRTSHEALMRQALNREADILIGTQMIAKGLHLPWVTVVGVICADVGLYQPDFRAGERAFQVLCQVAGRTGRGSRGGQVVVQTYSPDHYAVRFAAAQDYQGFFHREMDYRRRQGNPPFARLIRLLYTHTSLYQCQRETARVGRLLQEERRVLGLPDTTFIGPAPAYHQRVRGRFRWHIVIRGPDPHVLVQRLTLPQGWRVDVDPLDLT